MASEPRSRSLRVPSHATCNMRHTVWCCRVHRHHPATTHSASSDGCCCTFRCGGSEVDYRMPLLLRRQHAIAHPPMKCKAAKDPSIMFRPCADIVGETERTAITIGCMADATQRCAGAKRIPKIRQPSGNRSPVDSAESVRTSTANRSSRQAVRAKTKEPIGGGCASGRPCRVHG